MIDLCPKCRRAPHPETKVCELSNGAMSLELTRVSIALGADFETHGGKRVRRKPGPFDNAAWCHPPVGTLGTIKCTFDSWIEVDWDKGYEGPPWCGFSFQGWDQLDVVQEAVQPTGAQQ